MYHATQGIREKYSRSTELREYTECSLAWAACLVLVEWLCGQPPLSCGATVRAKDQIYFAVYYITKIKL